MAARADLDRYDALRADAAGVPRADAHQRAGAHLGLTHGREASAAAACATRGRRPLRGSRQPLRVTTTNRSGRPASRVTRRDRRGPRRRRRPAGRVHRGGSATSARRRRASGAGRPRGGRSAAHHRAHRQASGALVGRRVSQGGASSGRAGPADVQDRREDAGGARWSAWSRTARRSSSLCRARHRLLDQAHVNRTPNSARAWSWLPTGVHRFPAARLGGATVPHRTETRRSEGVLMGTVVVGYVPKPEGEAALARAIDEAKLRGDKLVVVNSHRGGSELRRRGRPARPTSRWRASRPSWTASGRRVRPPPAGPRLRARRGPDRHRRGQRRRADRHRPAPPLARRQADPGQQRPAHPARRPVPRAGRQGRRLTTRTPRTPEADDRP